MHDILLLNAFDDHLIANYIHRHVDIVDLHPVVSIFYFIPIRVQ